MCDKYIHGKEQVMKIYLNYSISFSALNKRPKMKREKTKRKRELKKAKGGGDQKEFFYSSLHSFHKNMPGLMLHQN